MRPRRPKSTRTDTLFPYTTLFRSDDAVALAAGVLGREHPLLVETVRWLAAGRIALAEDGVHVDGAPRAPLQLASNQRFACWRPDEQAPRPRPSRRARVAGGPRPGRPAPAGSGSSAARRAGKEGCRTCRSRWSTY